MLPNETSLTLYHMFTIAKSLEFDNILEYSLHYSYLLTNANWSLVYIRCLIG